MRNIPVICQNISCQKVFLTYPSKIKHNRAKFCSKSCQYSKSLIERFWEKVHKTDTCWIWTAYLDEKGYGHIGTNGKGTIGAHVLSYKIAFGDIPKGMFVCHNCPSGDNPACVNPSHLWLGTQKQNVQDAHKKGRINRKGTKNSSAKLTENDITYIRSVKDIIPMIQLAKEFHCTPENISSIWKRRTWKHVP